MQEDIANHRGANLHGFYQVAGLPNFTDSVAWGTSIQVRRVVQLRRQNASGAALTE